MIVALVGTLLLAALAAAGYWVVKHGDLGGASDPLQAEWDDLTPEIR